MTEPSKDIDFSSILQQSEKHSVSERQKGKLKKHLRVTAVAGAIILAFAGYLIFAFVAKTDFTSNIPLSENISRWTPLNWETDGIKDGDGVAFTANGTSWEPSDEGQYFQADVGEAVCTVKVSRLGNGLGTNDRNSSDAYTAEFRKSNEMNEVSDVWLDTTVDGVQIEFVKASYENTEGNPSYSYYRGSPENNGFVMLIASCSDEEALKEILPDEGGSEVAELALLKPSTFSPF